MGITFGERDFGNINVLVYYNVLKNCIIGFYIPSCVSGIEILISGEDIIFQGWEIGNLNLYDFLKNKAEWFTVPEIKAGADTGAI